MNNNFPRRKPGYLKLLQTGLLAGMAAMFFALPVASNAQETTSAIRGVVTDEGGQALANTTVTVRNEDSGLTRTAQTDAAGAFAVRNLPIGDNYTVAVSREGYGTERAEQVSLNLGQTADVGFALALSGAMEEVVTTGTRSVGTQVAVGPNVTFGLDTLETAPAINRNITDVLRADPRIYVDESRGDINAVQCAGRNSRFNSLTVDGVRLNDSFGLNSNGYPTERMPFSYDAIKQVAVELAPFDAEYGGFSACNINAVTKSGENQFFGGVFYDYSSDSLRSDSLEGESIQSGDYTDKRYGFNIGGPIIPDKVFSSRRMKTRGCKPVRPGPHGFRCRKRNHGHAG